MGFLDEHIREQDGRECRACGEHWPCRTYSMLEAESHRCSSCRRTLKECDDLINKQRRACCARCFSTDTHHQKLSLPKHQAIDQLEAELISHIRTVCNKYREQL